MQGTATIRITPEARRALTPADGAWILAAMASLGKPVYSGPVNQRLGDKRRAKNRAANRVARLSRRATRK